MDDTLDVRIICCVLQIIASVILLHRLIIIARTVEQTTLGLDACLLMWDAGVLLHGTPVPVRTLCRTPAEVKIVARATGW